MRIWIQLIFMFLVLLTSAIMQGQSVFVTQEKILAELEARNLDVDKVDAALKERGINIAYLDQATVTPQQITIIQEVILELEEEQAEAERMQVESKLSLPDMELDTLKEEDPESNVTVDTLVEEALDEVLIYGQQLFRNNIIDLQSSAEEIKAPDSYVLGPGDDLVISAWGRSQFDNEYQIDAQGYIKVLNDAKRIYLKGMTLGKAREKLYNVFNEYYSFTKGEFDVALNFSRTVKVSIYGEVYENPGSYAIPAFNSAFNALSIVKGTNDIGSLRNIKLQKANGSSMTMDIYAYMKNPNMAADYYLEENDIILIPVAEKLVSISGAIRRPMKYELINKEGITELLLYAGGFTENAFQKKVQIHRYENDQKRIIDLDWRQYEEANRNYELLAGDSVSIEAVEIEVTNYVDITGQVTKPGTYERSNGMKVYDLLKKANITNQARTDAAYLTRTNNDGTTEFIKLNLSAILSNPADAINLVLQDKDKLEVWSQERFKDDKNIAIDGAVRYPGRFPYDQSAQIRVKDAIMLAGGLRRDASSYAIIHRNDPLNPKIKYYKTINNLEDIFENPKEISNYVLSPFDSLVIKSKNVFIEESFVRIEGAVNIPGEFQYGQDMSIRDLLTLAGGFKLAASTNNIEISRVIIKDNEPTRTVVANIEMDRDFNVLSDKSSDYKLEPFDNIAVRYIKEFQLQKRVFLEGELAFPGPYAISKENEKILSIIERAGGLTDEAFPAGATLIRDDNDYGSVVIKLEQIIQNPNSEFNFYVKNGDKIFVPKIREFVTIVGATKAKEVVGKANINEGNAIHVPFHRGKDAMFYINEYAGGLHENADKSKIFVEHANGELKRPKTGFLVKRYPKVQQGSVITVGYKSLDKNKEEEKTDVDWTKVLGDSVAQAMSILTLILLIQRLD